MKVFRRSHVAVPAQSPPRQVNSASAADKRLSEQDACPVLVAVDGTSTGWNALEWAAAEAIARRCTLRIVHAIHPRPMTMDIFGNCSADRWDEKAEAIGKRVLGEAARRARIISPTLPIATHLRLGTPAATILWEEHANAMIVLGRAPDAGRFRWFDRSVSRRVVQHATCSVAIVELSDAWLRGSSAGRVVVGCSPGGEPDEGLGVAFQAARRRGIGLTVLLPLARGSERRDARVWGALSRFCGAFPDVDMRLRFTSDPAGDALITESAGAALVVLTSSAKRHHFRSGQGTAPLAIRSIRRPVVVVGRGDPGNTRQSTPDADPG
jgi:nucleotide-binding universal stress UspA family protein